MSDPVVTMPGIKIVMGILGHALFFFAANRFIDSQDSNVSVQAELNVSDVGPTSFRVRWSFNVQETVNVTEVSLSVEELGQDSQKWVAELTTPDLSGEHKFTDLFPMTAYQVCCHVAGAAFTNFGFVCKNATTSMLVLDQGLAQLEWVEKEQEMKSFFFLLGSLGLVTGCILAYVAHVYARKTKALDSDQEDREILIERSEITRPSLGSSESFKPLVETPSQALGEASVTTEEENSPEAVAAQRV